MPESPDQSPNIESDAGVSADGPGFDTSPHIAPVRYVSDAPGIGGQLKVRPGDFIVEEIPAYDPCGSGEHIYMYVQKVNLSTSQMVGIVANHFGVRVGDVGIAGLKDKRAVTRQVVSVHAPGKVPEDFPMLKHDLVSVLWTDLHTNKLRRGHLKGNRFAIKIRHTPIASVFSASKTLEILERQGVPNRAGEQRFGYLHNNHVIGHWLVLGQHKRAIDELLGPASLRTHTDLDEARENTGERSRDMYAKGDYVAAIKGLPAGAQTERAVLEGLLSGRAPDAIFRGLDDVQRTFFMSSLQSSIFNALLDARLEAGTFATLLEGDLAFKHDNHAVFPCNKATLEDPATGERLGKLEISPSGPMWGAGMLQAQGEPGRMELESLVKAGLTLEALQTYTDRGGDGLSGARRALRVPLTYPDVEAGSDEFGLYVRCSFELPPGSFATVVMQEVMKGGPIVRGIEAKK